MDIAAELGKLLDEAGATVKFGLRQQGHVPTVERMLRERKTWAEIGEAIGWDGNTAAEWYYRFEASWARTLQAEIRRATLHEVRREVEKHLYTNTKNGNRTAMLNIIDRLLGGA